MTDDEVIETDGQDVQPPEQLEDGIYLHLDEGIYHAQHRLSSSGIQQIMASEADFWFNSWMNPDREDKTTDAQLLGRAFHTARLEPELLRERFVRQIDYEDCPDALKTDSEVRAAIKAIFPQKEDHPDALKTDTDVKNALAELSQPKSVAGETAPDRRARLLGLSAGVLFWDMVLTEWETDHGPMAEPNDETTLERAHRLRSYGYEGHIWALEKAEFEAGLNGRTSLPRQFWDQVTADCEDMKRNPIAEKYLTGGLAEVSVLWTDSASGVAMKCRIDYLKASGFTDVKTFDNPQKKRLADCIADQFRYNRYYIQARVYHEGVEQIRVGGLQIMDAKESVTIDAIKRTENPLPCTYVFQQKKGVPNVIAVPVIMKRAHLSMIAGETNDPDLNRQVQERYSGDALFALRAEHEISNAIDTFAACMEKYGAKKKWRPLNPVIPIIDGSFPGFWLEGRWQ